MLMDTRDCPHGCNSVGQYLWKGQWHPCPIHGVKQETILKSGNLPDGTNMYDLLKIPSDYRAPEDYIENAALLFRNNPGLVNCTEESQQALKGIMDKIYRTIIDEQAIYPVSVYLYGAMVDLKPWMYTMQRVAMEKNLSVLPATTVNDLAGIIALLDYPTFQIEDELDIANISKYNKLAAVGADWFLQTNLSYADYLRASLLFIIDDQTTTPTNLKTLGGFLAERARRDLPTYVVSTNYMDRVREHLDSKGNRRYRLSHLTPYMLLSKRQAGEISRVNTSINSAVPDIKGVRGKEVAGHGQSQSYFGF